jgi:ABC-type antimicrobial peptide transport system permease subunit
VLVLRRAAALIAIGLVAGTAASLWAAGLVSSTLFGLHPRDPLTLAAAIAVPSAAGLWAGWLPARRASRIDPARVLHEG